MTENVLAPSVVVPTVSDLFFGFAKIAISGFGGVLPWARRIIVQQRRWMSADEFNDLFAICQFLPGPNIVNFSLIYGSRVGGVPGATAAVVGLVGPPTILMIVLGMLYTRYGSLPESRGALTVLVAGAALVGVGVLQWPLLAVLVVLVPISVARVWRTA
jgi:chromate transporter